MELHWKLWATGLVLGEEGDTAFYVSDLYSLYLLSVDIQPASPATMSSPSTAIHRLYPSENVKQNNPLSPKRIFYLSNKKSTKAITDKVLKSKNTQSVS